MFWAKLSGKALLPKPSFELNFTYLRQTIRIVTCIREPWWSLVLMGSYAGTTLLDQVNWPPTDPVLVPRHHVVRQFELRESDTKVRRYIQTYITKARKDGGGYHSRVFTNTFACPYHSRRRDHRAKWRNDGSANRSHPSYSGRRCRRHHRDRDRWSHSEEDEEDNPTEKATSPATGRSVHDQIRTSAPDRHDFQYLV